MLAQGARDEPHCAVMIHKLSSSRDFAAACVSSVAAGSPAAVVGVARGSNVDGSSGCWLAATTGVSSTTVVARRAI